MKTIIRKALDVSSDTYKHFGDLVGFIGLFSFATYIAAIQYFSAYYDQFFIRSAEIFDANRVVVYFLTGAVLDSVLNIVVLTAVGVIIALLFFIARTVLRPLYGYVMLCLMYVCIVLLLAFLGKLEGRADGIREWLLRESTLTRVTVRMNENEQMNATMEDHMKGKGLFLLLSQTPDYTVLLIPLVTLDDSSVRRVIQLPNSQIMDIVIEQHAH